MTDSFTLGHYLHNARRLYKHAADDAAVPQTPAPTTTTPNTQLRDDAIKRFRKRRAEDNVFNNYKRNLYDLKAEQARGDFNREQGLPDNGFKKIWNINYKTRLAADTMQGADKDKYLKDNLIDFKHPGDASVWAGTRPITALNAAQNGMLRTWGTNLPYGKAPMDPSFLSRNQNDMNTTLDTVMNPWFYGIAAANNGIPNISSHFTDNEKVIAGENLLRTGGTMYAGITAPNWMPGIVSQWVPKSMRPAAMAAGANLSKWTNRIAGPLQFAWMNVNQLTKPYDQLDREIAGSRQDIINSAPGNTWDAYGTRIWNNLANNGLPVVLDAPSYSMNPLAMMFSNGSIVRNLKGAYDHLIRPSSNPLLYGLRTAGETPWGRFITHTSPLAWAASKLSGGSMDKRTSQEKLYDDVFWSELYDGSQPWYMAPVEWLAGGRTAGKGAVAKEVERNAMAPVNNDKLHKWNEEMRAKGYNMAQRNQMFRELIEKQPTYFDMTEADLIRHNAKRR